MGGGANPVWSADDKTLFFNSKDERLLSVKLKISGDRLEAGEAKATPLAVPAWTTRPDTAHAKIVSTARLPVRVLLELRRVTTTCRCPSTYLHKSEYLGLGPVG